MYQLEKRVPQIDAQKRLQILAQVELDSKCAADCDYIVRNHDGQLEAALTQIMAIYSENKKNASASF
jgi:guanylate kinase